MTVFGDAGMPERVDTVIVGGGIIGVSAALCLAEAGQSVAVVEKGHIAGEQSSRNWGWCRQAMRDPREMDLAREALNLWRGMNARVGGDTGFTTCGTLYAARDEASLARYRRWTAHAAGAGIAAEVIEGAAVRALLPGDIDPPRRGLYCPGDGRAEPQRAVPLMAEAARRLGAHILTDCAARGVDVAGGRVVGVVTERGTIRAGRVIVAGGVWTRRILSDLGIALPQLPVRATVARTQPGFADGVRQGPLPDFLDGVFGVRRRADGGFTVANAYINSVPVIPASFRHFRAYWHLLRMEWRHVRFRLGEDFWREWRDGGPVPFDRVSPYERVRVLDPRPDRAYAEASLKALKERYPALGGLRLAQVWGGMIDATPDTVPVIAPVATIDGLVVATGFSGHGFGVGPAGGQLAADLVLGRKPLVDPTPFRLERYFDGTMPPPVYGV
ncbi:NAD(P)/FAD-dependent oxidoreductase [Novosphingobium nitrogenifigens]|nr:FAD-binding oxidoreductase [Novosphingobium nitrogenifigens]